MQKIEAPCYICARLTLAIPEKVPLCSRCEKAWKPRVEKVIVPVLKRPHDTLEMPAICTGKIHPSGSKKCSRHDPCFACHCTVASCNCDLNLGVGL